MEGVGLSYPYHPAPAKKSIGKVSIFSGIDWKPFECFYLITTFMRGLEVILFDRAMVRTILCVLASRVIKMGLKNGD